jgi:acyl-CoA reductase-like NAD-dependent aldehyde dehydrogenase
MEPGAPGSLDGCGTVRPTRRRIMSESKPPATAPLRLPPLDLCIGGAWRPAASGARRTTLDPATAQPIAAVADGDAADVDAAVRAAQTALGGAWGRMPAAERGKLLWKVGDLLLQHADELAALESADTGKPLAEARSIDVVLAADVFHYYAGAATKIEGTTIPVRGPFLAYTLREPVGVVGAITPWNFPLLLAARKLAAALAAGNAVIHKPAPETPLSALRMVELAYAAGFPAGAWNVVTGDGPTAGAALVDHAGVGAVAFTGSTAVGREIMRRCAAGPKKVSLELGGKSPHIVLADADLDAAARAAMLGIFYNQGEVCTAGSRLLVEASIHDRFMEMLLERSRKVQPGDPRDASTRLGPLVSEKQLATVQRYVDLGTKEGARLVLGGHRSATPNAAGYYFEPTIFDAVQPHMTIAREEIFGPVLATLQFGSLDEAVDVANAVDFGLAAGIWTRDVAVAHALARRLQAGTVWVNCYNMYDAAAPYGGYKASGFGRESGMAALDFYTQTKTVWVNVSTGEKKRG